MPRPLLLLLLALSLSCSGDAPTGTPGDADGDGYATADDCDDTDSAVHPDAAERCNEQDDNCDGTIDEGVVKTFYTDADHDGYGDPAQAQTGCTQPDGTVLSGDDCDDTVISINPGAAEVCDGIDNNCSGEADEGVLLTLYTDADGDGYGDAGATGEGCAAGGGLSETGDDCDDTNPAVHPGADEADCTDPTDYNCDGVTLFVDNDLDGWSACADCDDTDATFSPDAPELCDNLDNDCDGEIDESDATDAYLWYLDADADGYGDPDTTAYGCTAPSGYVDNSSDCDDLNGHVNPSIPEICDGFDDDCDGLKDEGC